MRDYIIVGTFLFVGVGCFSGGSQGPSEIGGAVKPPVTPQATSAPAVQKEPQSESKDPKGVTPQGESLEEVKEEFQIEPLEETKEDLLKGVLEKHPEEIQTKSRPIPKKPSSLTQEVLHIGVLYATSQRAHPRLPTSQVIPEENVTRTPLETIFHTKFFLPKKGVRGKQPFFAWPDHLAGSRIQTASYSHRVLRKGEWVGNYRPKKVWYDDVQSRWFIPFYDIFEDSDFYLEEDAELSDLQVLVLDLVLKSGQRLQYQIQFQVVGPLPDLELSSLQAPPLADVPVVGDQVATGGWIVKKEELFNSSPHSLWVGLKVPETRQQRLTLSTYLGHSSYTEQAQAAPLGPFWESWISQAALKVSAVRVRHFHDGREVAVAETVRFESEDWKNVAIQPGETLVFEWLAQVRSGVKDCNLPDPQIVTLSWVEPAPPVVVSVPVLRGTAWGALDGGIEKLHSSAQAPIRFFKNVTQEWVYQGTKITGSWNREVALFFPFVSSPGEEGISKKISAELIEISAKRGETLPNPRQHSCQGVFR